jgi:precorrin-2/cobalt-factor-2 C20-methyltransferase
VNVSTVYGLGVGPGDPGLVTVRTAQVLAAADLVIAPRATSDHRSAALTIVREHVAEGCEVLEAVFPMTDDAGERSAAARDAADRLAAAARAGRTPAMVTLGDAMTYSTWGYVLRELTARHADVPVVTVAGVTSFAAAAASIGEPLAEGAEPLLVWPAAHPSDIGALLEIAPNVVALKVGRSLGALIDEAHAAGARVAAVRRLGMDGEEVASDAADLLGGRGDYFTTAIVHKEGR